MSNYELITEPACFAEICEQLLDEPVVAADTEFFWERTYYPILGLVQLSTSEGRCFLVDTIALTDLSALAPVLESKSVIKILHDAPQDLSILALATGASPRNIFDTRTSSGFAGFESTTSLQNLLRTALNIDLPKAETRSNWVRRPLTENQLKYAADDVLHLPALREHIIQSCKDPLVQQWMCEENALLDNPSTFRERDPREMFLRVKGSSRLNARQLAVLREIAEWRENKARHRNLPRGYILTDPTLIELARSTPTNVSIAKSIADFPRKMPVGVVADLLNAIARGQTCPEEDCPKPDNLFSRNNLKAQTKELLTHIRGECEKRGIDPALAASRADAEAYLMKAEKEKATPLKLSQGWRRVVIAEYNAGQRK